MLKVSNKKCIRRLSDKSLKAARTRNLIAVLAIALTTLLFTSLFTIAMTINNSFQQQTFRQVGGDMMGTFKDLTEEQVIDLSDDPLITKWGARLMLGFPTEAPFNKSHVEVSYMDKNNAEGYFCMPETGSLPREGTDEIAVDTRILKLLGVPQKLGSKLTMPFELGNGEKRADTFTLSGFWEYDPASMASMAIVPRSYADEVLAGYERAGDYDSTGLWTLNLYLKSSLHIRDDLKQIAENHGYQIDDEYAENFLKTGVNWAYSGAQFSANLDLSVVLAIAALLLLIVFTGYLIIYNVFRISVTSDIRFYGLLKTIGTTGKQIKRLLRHQAYLLSLIGIPIGLVLGFFIGTQLVPIIMAQLSYTVAHVSAHPAIFIGAALFSLVTVRISCAKPGRIAARVSPIEAVRYTESSGGSKKSKKHVGRAGLGTMAMHNLGRSKSRTVLTVVSLALAVVLLNGVYMFAQGFDMDKYLRSWIVTDFIFGDAGYFQTGQGYTSVTQSVTEDAIDTINAQGEVTESGRIYAQPAFTDEFVPEEWFRQGHGRWNSPEIVEAMMESLERTEDGRVCDRTELFGMEDFPLDQLNVIDGDLSPLYDESQNAIAAVYMTNDYDEVYENSHWVGPGDTVTLRHIKEYEYYDIRTGIVGDPEAIEPGYLGQRAKTYKDVTYNVCASVTIKNAMGFRHAGADQFVLNAEVLKRDAQREVGVMTYLFNTTDESNANMEAFLKDYTETVQPSYDYESKQSYVDEFNGFRNMFMTVGGALALIIGLVGVLNFLNAVLTSILTRRREFAVLQAVGMTGKQLKRMLTNEGLLYTGFSLGLALILSAATGIVLQTALSSMFWFFTARFTLLPVLLLVPVFVLLGIVLPRLCYRVISKQSVVERIRTED
ncbi:ABC transporter permease [Agathobaculum sp.]|uniref:ABC transporter permease n=1 Tax=Agathobaculum sp. TaxID=2048138 RepID=UPI002A8046D0|nr:ABC transporter permease [Agathobaculum sp.]MDY3618750.1 ABC transporter permease [Agathobaculum sp.]